MTLYRPVPRPTVRVEKAGPEFFAYCAHCQWKHVSHDRGAAEAYAELHRQAHRAGRMAAT